MSEFLNQQEAAQMIGRSLPTFNNLDRAGLTPPGFHVGRRRVWLRKDFEAFIESRGFCRTHDEWQAAKDHAKITEQQHESN
ncbi:MAG: helix-turn-helix domain-containing protein [Fimbriimonadaceae bacterium]|nr:helix-turn-helix domain-containing protein [Alphaproteobacteria bacterium]